jgi:hypothetical protein
MNHAIWKTSYLNGRSNYLRNFFPNQIPHHEEKLHYKAIRLKALSLCHIMFEQGVIRLLR